MKKIFLSALLFVMLFAMSFESSNSSCPSGYTAASFSFNHPSIWGCTITVDYCYQCAPSSNGVKTILDKISFSTNCFPSLALNVSFFNMVSDEVMKNVKTLCTIGPCPNNSTNYSEVTRAVCVNLVNQPLGNDEHNTWMEFCNDDGATCTRYYSACWQQTPPPPTFQATYVSTVTNGSASCNSTVPSIPPTGYNYNQEWPYYCFIIACQ